MFFIPTAILGVWLTGLLALGIIGAGAYLAWLWYDRAWVLDPIRERYLFDPDFGWNRETALLAGGLALLVWAVAGGLIVRLMLSLVSSGRSGAGASADAADPDADVPRGEVRRLRRPDGSELHVELIGPEDGPSIVLTHGWGCNADEWNDLKRRLAGRFRLIAWDLPGLGRSRRPDNGDYRLENLAQDLEAVLGLAGGRPAVLLGHSIGGMITLTYCRLFPESLGPRVAGLVLTHTTPTNPVRTTKHAALYTALERPVLVPLLHLTIWLSPLVWLMNWLSYLNGSAHISAKRSGFAGTETRAQVDFATRFNLQASPAVLARGMFGMLHYDAMPILGSIAVPTLVIPGDRDPVCLPEASETMHRAISGARLTTLAPARHMGLIEHGSTFAAAVEEFTLNCTRAGAVSGTEGVTLGS